MAEFQTNACGTICLCLLNLLAIRCLQLWSQPMGPLCLWQCFKIILCCFQFIESVHCANNDAMEVISVGGCVSTIISCAGGCEMPSQPFASENPLTAAAQQIQFPFISLHLFDFY